MISFIRFLLLFFLPTLELFSQSATNIIEYESVENLRDRIYANVQGNKSNTMYNRLYYRFAHEYAVWTSNLYTGYWIYSDKSAFENYLTEIFNRIKPVEIGDIHKIKIRILKESEFNNYCMLPTGDLMISMGVFPEAYNERILAAEIAHHLAHYYLNHPLQHFLQEETGGFEGVMLDSPKKRFNEKNEFKADSLAINWMKNTPYGAKAVLEYLELQDLLYKHDLKKGKEWKLNNSPHPYSENRLKRAIIICGGTSLSEEKAFLISNNTFDSLRNIARAEVLSLSLSAGDYKECMEKAFRFHLFDPDNKIYIYYLMESIRRHCYLYPLKWKENFITNDFYDSVDVSGRIQKEPTKDHLFKKFDFSIIPISVFEGPKLKAKFYWKGQPRFVSYEGAFEFYYAVSKQLDIHESILSYALSFYDDNEKQTLLLREYLAKDPIKHRDFASKLLDGKLYSSLEKRKLSVIDHFEITIGQKKDKIPFPESFPGKSEFLHKLLENITTKSADRIPILLADIKLKDKSTFELISKIERFTYSPISTRNEKVKFYILAPEYWDFFNLQRVNEIEFITGSYFNSYTKDRTLETYKKIIGMNCSELFNLTTSTNYFEYSIIGLRAVDNGVMMASDAQGDLEINPELDNVEKQITNHIKGGLIEKDKRASKLDFLYRERMK